MFKETKVLPFFPTSVWAHTLEPEVYEPLNERLKKHIYDQLAAGPESAKQTRNDLHKLAEFQELIPYFDSATTGILNFLALEYSGYEITGCWANVRPVGSSQHQAHTHPNNYLSGVYYVDAHAGANVINFHDPRAQVNIIAPKRTEFNEYNTRDVHLTVKTGSLVMFPAWLSHSVEPNTSDTDRISISFNVMFTSFSEEMSTPRWKPK